MRRTRIKYETYNSIEWVYKCACIRGATTRPLASPDAKDKCDNIRNSYNFRQFFLWPILLSFVDPALCKWSLIITFARSRQSRALERWTDIIYEGAAAALIGIFHSIYVGTCTQNQTCLPAITILSKYYFTCLHNMFLLAKSLSSWWRTRNIYVW